ncbi:MAG: homoserine O-acetyltransferase [Candidatus Latescibacteria bacterium]|nr:homoserine O-acetyltransferase [Candidatus Latescibacterota bacterium]
MGIIFVQPLDENSMDEHFFNSSDGVRSGSPLKYLRRVTFEEPLELTMGGELPGVTVAFETYGRLNAARDNAVLICHAISGDSHVARHDASDDPGWWDLAVGPGKPIDTTRNFVICPNVLGGCRGTTGPGSICPKTGRPYGRDFPVITTEDMVEVQRRLLDHLGIEKLLAVVGGSAGGHQVLVWATKLSHRVRGVIPIATSARLTSQALAFDIIGRNAILRDPNFREGQYYDKEPPEAGLAIARMLGHITYLSPKAMDEKFEMDRYHPREIQTVFEKKFSVGSYLAYQGQKFVERFDANSYTALSMAMDLFDLGADRPKLIAAVAGSSCRWLVISFSSDWLFPPKGSRELVDALIASDKKVSYCNVESDCGHDAFLLPDDLERYGALTRAFLSNLNGRRPPVLPEAGREDHHPTSIFHGARLDYGRILELIPFDASVLDLGCGNGALLGRLKERGHKRILGLELDEQAIVACVHRGVDCIHADMNRGLENFGDGQFDVVVLSRTLQAVKDVEGLLEDILRVGRQCILSFPNFGYHKLRKMLMEQGRAPESPGVLQYKWYNTPNRRFFTVSDFEAFCEDRNIHIHRIIGLDTEAGFEVVDHPNLGADLAVFVISR